MILDATQFRQLVAEVSMTIAADSTGVGEIEIVDSLAGITSLPALKIEYGRETVVEAPLSLLSKRADDAAQEAQEAIAAADAASVLAAAAADRADAERVNLEEIKHLTQLVTSEALTQTNVSRDETRLTGETRLATLATLTDLQRKLVDVVIVIADAHTGVEELAEYQKRADEVLFIVARNTEELLKISEELKTLRAQVAEVTRQAFVAIAACNLSTDDARLFASLAQQAAEVANIAGAGADVAGEYARLQAFDAEVAAKEARDTSVELQKSIVASDSIAALAKENALLANDAAKGAELEVEESALLRQELTHIAEQAEQASNHAIDSAAGADAAAAHAKEQAEAAKVAMQDATDTSTHPTFIGDDYYVYVWDKATKAYNKTAIFVKGDAFSFAKSYTTISEMESDFSNVTEGRFVLINTNDAEQTDNAKIYIRTENSFEFLVDMSGAIGFSGKTPQFIKGEITTGDAGTGAQVSLSEAGIDGNGNPIYALNIVIPRGMDGTPCTHSWEGTVLTVTSASGTSSANLKGIDGNSLDIADNLTTNDGAKALSAAQGVKLSKQIVEVGKNAGGKMVLIPGAVLNLTNSTSSEDILNAFGGKSAYADIVQKITNGALACVVVDGIYLTLPLFLGTIDEESGTNVLGFIVKSPMKGVGKDAIFEFSLTGDIMSLSRGNIIFGDANIVSIPFAFIDLTNESTSEEVLTAFGGLDKLQEIVDKVKEGNAIAVSCISNTQDDGVVHSATSIISTIMVQSWRDAINFNLILSAESGGVQQWVVSITNGIASVTKNQTNYMGTSDLADDLVTDDASKALSAKQGKVLNEEKANKRKIVIEDYYYWNEEAQVEERGIKFKAGKAPYIVEFNCHYYPSVVFIIDLDGVGKKIKTFPVDDGGVFFRQVVEYRPDGYIYIYENTGMQPIAEAVIYQLG